MSESVLSLGIAYPLKQPEHILELLCHDYVASQGYHPQLSYFHNHIAVSDYYTAVMTNPVLVAGLKLFLSHNKSTKTLLLIDIKEHIDTIIIADTHDIDTGIGLLSNKTIDIVDILDTNRISYLYSDKPEDFRDIQCSLSAIKLYSDISSVCMMIVPYTMLHMLYDLVYTIPQSTSCLIQATHDIHPQICDYLVDKENVQ